VPSPFLHIWQADLAADLPSWQAAEATLSAAERARQARLRTPTLRQTYGRAHGFLRAVLSPYVSQAASALAFRPDHHGKPMLAGPTLHFNLSYRAGRALLAVADTQAVGVDVEPLTPLADAAALVQELFAPAEQQALRAAAPADYWPLFYTIWTRKEAYAKALGMGLTLPFGAFSVLEGITAGPPLLTGPAGASLHSFAAGPGYVGAVAALAPGAVAPRFFNYPADLLSGPVC